MLKKTFILITLLLVALSFASCEKETKELTCDGCGKLVEVEADSNMTDEWILFCEECGEPEITFENPFEQQ